MISDPYRPIPMVTSKPLTRPSSYSFYRPTTTTYKPYPPSSQHSSSSYHHHTSTNLLNDDSYPLYPGDAIKFRPSGGRPTSLPKPVIPAPSYDLDPITNNDIYSNRPSSSDYDKKYRPYNPRPSSNPPDRSHSSSGSSSASIFGLHSSSKGKYSLGNVMHKSHFSNALLKILFFLKNSHVIEPWKYNYLFNSASNELTSR